jgi:acyl-coenzyme A synthetase/AMP-(fatty) acid ligase
MLMRGGTILLYGQDSITTVQSLDLFKIQSMVTSPHGLAQHLKFYEAETTFRCNFDHILVVGGQLTAELARRARLTMCPRLISYFGATECGSIASADARDVMEVPGAVGYVLPGSTVEIVDADENPLPRGQEGRLRLRTSDTEMAQGYVRDPDASAAAFRDGWFYSGDVGNLSSDNLLIVSGRAQTRLNIGGDKINPELIEDVIKSFPGISDAAAFSIADGLGIEQVQALVVLKSLIDEKALRDFCKARLQPVFVPIRYTPVSAIPRNEMGKIERPRLPEMANR